MTTKNIFFLTFFGLTGLLNYSQNVQSNALATSGGLEAGTILSGMGNNTFYGFRSGQNSTTGTQNTIIGGYSSASLSSGSYNTVIGANAGLNISSSNNNTFIGFYAGGENEGNNNLFIGTQAGGENYSSNSVLIGNHVGYYDQTSNKLLIDNLMVGESLVNPPKPLIWGDFAEDKLKFNAKVGVGYGFNNYPTTAGSVNVSNYNLFVKGGILTEEVRVSLQSTWADYVFAKEYKLPTLNEVENHIKEKGHLINVPSAKEVKENGIELGEMAKIQQEKIEELTLYVIEQNKINEKQKQEIEELKAQMKLLLEKK
jgi:hypothetical protein